MPQAFINKLKLLLLITLWGVASVNAQTFQWAKRIGNTPSAGQDIRSSATDAAGNIYITGYFWGTVDFDPNAGVYNLTSLGGNDVFVCKLSPAGNFLWAKYFPGSAGDLSNAITVDATSNVYVTGYFQGTTDFDPNGGTFNLTTLGGPDAFLCKLSSAGNLVWVKRFGSATHSDIGGSVITDTGGNVYLSGHHGATIDADPGTGVFNLTGQGSFLIKLNSAGNFIWAKQTAGTNTSVKIALDAGGNVYLAGVFGGSVDFDPGPGTYTLTAFGGDVFVLKLTTAGNFVWVRIIIGGTGAGDNNVYGIAVDAAGNVHTTGYFEGVGDFDPGPAVYNLIATGTGVLACDMFVSKLNTSGNFVWAKRIGGTSRTLGMAIDLDATGNVYTTGLFQGTADFNPGAATNNL